MSVQLTAGCPRSQFSHGTERLELAVEEPPTPRDARVIEDLSEEEGAASPRMRRARPGRLWPDSLRRAGQRRLQALVVAHLGGHRPAGELEYELPVWWSIPLVGEFHGVGQLACVEIGVPSRSTLRRCWHISTLPRPSSRSEDALRPRMTRRGYRRPSRAPTARPATCCTCW
jgi:hypothetical protein